MPCFGKKAVEIVPCTSEDGAQSKAAGRLESDGKPGAPAMRDGLHSAPTSQDRAADDARRQGLHSAPQGKADTAKGNDANGKASPAEPIGDFILEAGDGNQPTAAAVDAYLDDAIGTKIVKKLRGDEWASRVKGLEMLQNLVKDASDPTNREAATGEPAQDESSERSALFRACVTVLARALQDKVVPVYLPALALLAEVYSPPFLAPISQGKLPKAAVACFANQLVFRSGSSNVRAREESSAALLTLARCDAVGCKAVAPFALKPVSNSKSANAAVGRLELLRTLVAEFSLGDASGLQLKEVLAFTLPLCECAAEKSRDAALGLVIDVRQIFPAKAEKMIEELRPSVLPVVKARLAPPDPAKANGPAGLSVNGKRLPPLPSIGASGAPLPGAMPDGEEILAIAGTPPNADSRARARSTATELGARAAPPPKKKPSKRANGEARRRDDDDPDGLLAEASSILGDEAPRPVRLAAGNAGVSPSKHEKGGRGRPSPSGGANPDDLTELISEEALMQEILEATR